VDENLANTPQRRCFLLRPVAGSPCPVQAQPIGIEAFLRFARNIIGGTQIVQRGGLQTWPPGFPENCGSSTLELGSFPGVTIPQLDHAAPCEYPSLLVALAKALEQQK